MKRTWLKYLAIIAMTLDHIAIMFLSNNIGIYFIFRFLGRITFPIMCFFLSEGFKYTHDKKKYLTRLIALAFISQFFFCLFNNKTLLTYKFFTELNTIYSLVLAF